MVTLPTRESQQRELAIVKLVEREAVRRRGEKKTNLQNLINIQKSSVT